MSALALPFLVVAFATLALLAYVVVLSRHKKDARRPLRIVGRVASVQTPLKPEGFVLVDGELWRARTSDDLFVERGGVRVVGARDCVLEVEPLARAGRKSFTSDSGAAEFRESRAPFPGNAPVVAREVLFSESASTEEVEP